MNILANTFVPHSIQQLSTAEPAAIHYPLEDQFQLLGFLDCEAVRQQLPALTLNQTLHSNNSNKWELEPNWNREIKENFSEDAAIRAPIRGKAKKATDMKTAESANHEWTNSLLKWLEREWTERERKYIRFELHQAKVKLLKDKWARITIPGLADADPPILIGGWVQVTYEDCYRIVHQVRSRIFQTVRAQSIVTCAWPEGIPLPPAHKPGMRPSNFEANVKLFENLLFHERLKEAVILASRIPTIEQMLYPTDPATTTNLGPLVIPLKFVNEKLNFKQQEFVNLALRVPLSFDESPCNVRILFGPPGTGKTMVAVETVLQLILKNSNSEEMSHILVCAPSISASDTLALRLMNGLERLNLKTKDIMFRLNDGTRQMDSLPTQLLSVCASDEANGRFIFPPVDKLLSYRIVVCTCLDAALLQDCGLSNGNLYNARQWYHQAAAEGYKSLGLSPAAPLVIPVAHWTHLVIDEAGQASEPETLIPITAAWSPLLQVLLFGDPRQLACRVFSNANKDTSLMERLLKRPLYSNQGTLGRITNPYNTDLVVLLSHNYRSHSSLLMTPSVLFYHDEMVSCGESAIINKAIGYKASGESVGAAWPIYFVDVQGNDLHSIYETTALASWANREEADKVVELILELLKDGVAETENEISVITPFRGQVALIRSLLRKSNCGRVNVGNVLDFQGKESGIVIASCVRSINAVKSGRDVDGSGFIGKPKEFNVAITRAVSLLVVVGNEEVLKLDGWIHQFILFCRRHQRFSSNQADESLGPLPPTLQSTLSVYDDTPPPRDKSLQSVLERRWIAS